MRFACIPDCDKQTKNPYYSHRDHANQRGVSPAMVVGNRFVHVGLTFGNIGTQFCEVCLGRQTLDGFLKGFNAGFHLVIMGWATAMRHSFLDSAYAALGIQVVSELSHWHNFQARTASHLCAHPVH